MTIPPNAEKYLLEADHLRRQQLSSALLHGSDRTWRERRRSWPAAVGGIIAIVVIVAVVAIVGAYQRQQRIADEKAAPAPLHNHAQARSGGASSHTWSISVSS
ncbi:MAG TPA: hypothetical protein VFC00_04750 [Micromonosporaceae bacterium]|nr:hypothetical protein [Micromonosporaceae bacterium]